MTVAGTRSETEIALVDVTKRYGATDAAPVSRLSWTFQPAGFHAVAGPSGSGKTTLLNLIAALESPDAGEVWVGGERIDGLNATQAAEWRQAAIGYLSQHSTPVGFLSARENVELGLRLRGFGEDEGRKHAHDTLDALGVSSLAERKADRLSGGELRRVALARAVASGPRVLVVDEPTAYLDRVSGRLVIGLLRRLTRETGIMVIAASHDPDLVASADSVLAFGGATRSARREPA
ncbi:MAG: ATP-binding cassette domain-containing protein [Gaiellaceae bacterium MAG52_C11]|nr:ATP-binding cassette domain-containing protein [Candidatus Gaiellasilicea maunaloa]